MGTTDTLEQNTVIITVTTLVDARGDSGKKNRYLVKQLYADNGKSGNEFVVMISEAATKTIGSNEAAKTGDASAVSKPTSVAEVAAWDKNAPFGQLNETVILPEGAQAPKIDMILDDPARIIEANQGNLFVESADSFLSDCGRYQGNANSFFDSNSQVFASFEQLAAAQSGAVIIINNNIIIDNNNSEHHSEDLFLSFY